MPRHPTDTQLASILTCLTPAVTLLNELYDGFGTPFVQAISNTTLALVCTVQNVKKNKRECIQLMENIHTLVYAIVQLYIKSEPAGSLSPTILDHIGNFTKTLHKIHTFCEAQLQLDTNRLRLLFRHNEKNTLFNECLAGLQQASEVFKACLVWQLINECA
ncbi:hypothetical protein FB451DRAFT_1568229 [Mycena latifolia]|nr:hypothetical protein FB451DRAFT_1568229 [Mycena latifolia]